MTTVRHCCAKSSEPPFIGHHCVENSSASMFMALACFDASTDLEDFGQVHGVAVKYRNANEIRIHRLRQSPQLCKPTLDPGMSRVHEKMVK